MDSVATLAAKDRSELFTEVSAQMGLLPIIIEKDFWVCWALHQLSHITDTTHPVIFKGGTSLSKAFHIINRFSEDIDLAFHRSAFGFDEELFAEESKTAKRRRVNALKTDCARYISENFKPALQNVYEKILGRDTWSIEIDANDPGQQTLVFHYPRCLQEGEYGNKTYIKPAVLLELGSTSDHEPSSIETISPFAAELFPDYFSNPTTSVRVLSAERTFWEKLTILHAEYHRPDTSSPKPRLSRHYYDSVMIYRTAPGKTAITNVALLNTVANHKDSFFPSAWARYDLAKPGTLRLVPGNELTKWLRKDYKDMEEMIFEEAPTFEEIVAELEEMEIFIDTK